MTRTRQPFLRAGMPSTHFYMPRELYLVAASDATRPSCGCCVQDIIAGSQEVAKVFSRTSMLVLDEADRLLEPSFEGVWSGIASCNTERPEPRAVLCLSGLPCLPQVYLSATLYPL